MKKGPLIITAALALTVGSLLAPAAALAQRPREGAGAGRAPGSGRPAGSQQSFAHHHPFVARPFVRSFVRPFFPFVVVGAAHGSIFTSESSAWIRRRSRESPSACRKWTMSQILSGVPGGAAATRSWNAVIPAGMWI